MVNILLKSMGFGDHLALNPLVHLVTVVMANVLILKLSVPLFLHLQYGDIYHYLHHKVDIRVKKLNAGKVVRTTTNECAISVIPTGC